MHTLWYCKNDPVNGVSLYITISHLPHYHLSSSSLPSLIFHITISQLPHYHLSSSSLPSLIFLITISHLPHYHLSSSSLPSLIFLITISHLPHYQWPGMSLNCAPTRVCRKSASRPGYVVKVRTDPGYVVKQCPRIVMNKIFDWHWYNRFNLRWLCR